MQAPSPSSTLTATENAVNNSVGVVDLLAEDDSKMPAAAKRPSETVIDLCVDEDNDPAAAYAASMVSALKKQKRRRKRPTKAAFAAAADAIEVDSLVAAKRSPVDEYRQALGPMRFDFVDNLAHHSFEKNEQNGQLKTNKVYKELLEYKLNLPLELSSSIFVRAVESRLDIIRALITGPEDTPYGFGCFLFDIYLGDYPRKPPQVKFLTTGGGSIRFNPNLYACGKVCLSLLGTWTGPGWQANKSTLLQVLVSIQALILVPDPYFNEPGYAESKAPFHRKQAEDYVKTTRSSTVQHAVEDFLLQCLGRRKVVYPEFADIMTIHFCQQAAAIESQLDSWSQEDGSICTHAERVRGLLYELVAANDTKPAAKPKEPEILTID